jgi:hypothetical protein
MVSPSEVPHRPTPQQWWQSSHCAWITGKPSPTLFRTFPGSPEGSIQGYVRIGDKSSATLCPAPGAYLQGQSCKT